ncbi:hypothetical protein ACVXHA_23005 [Escherichia coli]
MNRGMVIYFSMMKSRPANLSLNTFVGCGASAIDLRVRYLWLAG